MRRFAINVEVEVMKLETKEAVDCKWVERKEENRKKFSTPANFPPIPFNQIYRSRQNRRLKGLTRLRHLPARTQILYTIYKCVKRN